MSWQASRWAKSQRGFDSPVEKLVLMVLADYADSERFECWPSPEDFGRGLR